MVRTPRTPRIEVKEDASNEVIPFEPKMITVGVFIREKGPLGKAFAATMMLAKSGRETKLTRDEWDKQFSAWLKQPR